MAFSQDVVRRMTVVATEHGLTSLNTKLRENDRLTNQVAASHGRMATATEQADRRMQAVLRQRDRAMAAFNAGGLAGVGGMAGASASSFAMSNVAPIVAGVAAVTAAYMALNKVWDTGAGLLEKYANAHRLVDPADLESNLKSITKFQQDSISAAQVQRATELGTRLQDAKFTIDQFFKVQLDIVDPALKLQAAWVTIVESIAEGTRQLDKFLEKVPSIPGAGAVGKAILTAIPGVGGVIGAGSAALDLLAGPKPEAATNTEALAAAYGKLGAALEVLAVSRGDAPETLVTFAGRFADAIKQIDDAMKKGAETNKKAAESAGEVRTAWDRAVDSANKRIAVMEADARAVGLGVAAQAKFRMEAELTEAALRSGLDPAAEAVAKKIEAMGDKAGKTAQELAKLRLNDQIKFDSDTMFFTDKERDIAREMKNLYGPEWQANMDSVEAKQLRINNAMRDMKDATVDFAKTFVQGMIDGKSATEVLTASLTQLGQKLVDAGVTNAIMGIATGNAAQAAAGGVQVAAGWGMQMFGQSAQQKQAAAQAEAERLAMIEQRNAAKKSLVNQYTLRGALAGVTADGLTGQLESFDLRAAAELRQIKSTPGMGKHELVVAEEAIAKERLQIIRDFQKQAAEAEAERRKTYEDRLLMVGLDMSKMEDALVAFDRRALREREAEMKAGGEAILDLERTLAAERLALQEEYNQRAVQAEEERIAALTQTTKSVLDYVRQLQTGDASPLSPAARLAAAQLNYNQTKSAAAGGDLEAYGRFTEAAETFRMAAQAMYGSAAGYQTVFNQVVADALNLTQPAAAADPVVTKLQDLIAAVGLANGSIVSAGNNTFAAVQANTNAVNAQGGATTTAIGVNTTATNAQGQAVTGAVGYNTDRTIAWSDVLAWHLQNTVAGATNAQGNAAVAWLQANYNVTDAQGNAAQWWLQQNMGAVNAQGGATTAAVNATTGAVGQTTGTISSTSAASDAIAVQQRSLLESQNTLIAGQSNLISGQSSVLIAIRDLSTVQRQIGNGLGGLMSQIGSNQVLWLEAIRFYTLRTAQNTGGVPSGNSPPVGNWSWAGFEKGGVVSNGIYGRDSVMAMLAGGEGVLTAAATAAIGGRSAIDYINRAHMLPSNDNGGVIAAINNMSRTMSSLLTRIAALEEKNARLTEELIEQNSEWQSDDKRNNKRPSGKSGRGSVAA